jgi:Raf kinase inhibitor-like YbhB/YbcL family protein
MTIKVESSAFQDGGFIPEKHTCDGEDVSPPLQWGPVPEGTVTWALVCDDPDAPMGTWVHWVVYDLPADVVGLPENVLPEKELENGGKQGVNDFQEIGYGGPCPPSGEHRYFFKLYALDTKLNLNPGVTKSHLMIAMEEHVIGQGLILGKYSR